VEATEEELLRELRGIAARLEAVKASIRARQA
jgi:hypothetical protein